MLNTFRMHADAETFGPLGFAAKVGLEIHFDLDITPGEFIAATDDPRPPLIDSERITGFIRSDGRMYDTAAVRAAPYDIDDDGELGVELLSDDPDLNLENSVSYLVSAEMPGRRQLFAPYYITGLPADDTIQYLANYAPGPGHTLTGDLRGPAGPGFPRPVAARLPDALIVGAITRDSNGAPTAAAVIWPDGSPGNYTADALSSAFPGAVDSYHITYGSPVTKTYTQPTVTRDSSGAPITVPAIVES